VSVKTWSTPVSEEEQRHIPCTLCGAADATSSDHKPSLNGGQFKPFLSCGGFSYVKCNSCGLVQINPQPVVEDVERRYRDSYGNEYLTYQLKNEKAFFELQKLSLADMDFDRMEKEMKERNVGQPKVLDIGCATGVMLSFLRDRGWQTTGVEISPSAEYAQNERGLNVYRSTLNDCRFSPESFDLVLASHLVEHLNDPQAFFAEARRILRPDAYLILITPNISGFQARLLGSRWRSAIFDHLYLFSKRTITAMLKKQGFTSERIYTWGGIAAGLAPAPLKSFADRAVKVLRLGDVMAVKARKPM
jgi:2-polyprenyl-3-methyl-5-hydroxy-6-metoxy-1,4-benzoquinol methylase